MEPDYPGNMYISYKGLEILCSGLRGINANKLFITIHSINDKKSECMRAEIAGGKMEPYFLAIHTEKTFYTEQLNGLLTFYNI